MDRTRTLSILAALALAPGCVPDPPSTRDDDSEAGDDDTTEPADDDDDAVGDDDDAAVDRLAVLSLNLHCLITDGTPFATNAERLAAVAEAAAAEGVVAVALQEVCQREGESALELLEGSLEEATGNSWSSTWAFSHLAWEGTGDEAEEGVALLVEGAITGGEVLTYFVQGDLQRVAVAATLSPALGSLRLVSVHLDHEDADVRAAQARQSATAALASHDSLGVLVAGDLNDQEGGSAHGALLQMGFEDLTDPLDAGRIDHILAHRGAPVRADEAVLMFDGGAYPEVSDHPGVLVRLETVGVVEPEVTRIIAQVDVGWGHHLTVRGDTAPLSWDVGWPAYPAEDARWELVLTELPEGTFEYKVLVDDETWQGGDNEVGTTGEDNEVVPTF